MKANRFIGGYLNLELDNKNTIYHPHAIELNAGRYALEYILLARRYSKIYIPYYICKSILQPIERLGIPYEFYRINQQLEPIIDFTPTKDEVILYVNYFGLMNSFTRNICQRPINFIIDCTQAFFYIPHYSHPHKGYHCDTFYSCRKFFGVADGAYLVTDKTLNTILERDYSYNRMSHLLKRIDLNPEEAYTEFLANEASLNVTGLKSMSRLTEALMKGINYQTVKAQRINNFNTLNEVLGIYNEFQWNNAKDDNVPLVYPFKTKNGHKLRKKLINQKVFCACYWPNVLEWCNPNDLEYQFASNIVFLPIDQRYNKNDMNHICDIILN